MVGRSRLGGGGVGGGTGNSIKSQWTTEEHCERQNNLTRPGCSPKKGGDLWIQSLSLSDP